MNDIIKVNGTVLSASPIGEQDKRLVIQTCELGRITAFAPNCRRNSSMLCAGANPFVTGKFSIIPGRNAYRISEISAIDYFRELASLQPGVYMGFYFLDLVDFYGREGIDGTDMLNLLYVSLKSLERGQIEDNLIRRIFELKLMVINGDYAPSADEMPPRIYSVCRFITDSPTEKLYTFRLSEELLSSLEKVCDKAIKRVVDKELKSKKIMEAFYNSKLP